MRPGGTTRRSDRGDARSRTQRQRTVRTCRDLQFGALLSAVRGEMEWKSGKNGLVVLNLLAIGARFGMNHKFYIYFEGVVVLEVCLHIAVFLLYLSP